MTAFPSAEDYVRAVQRPDLTFRTDALRRAVFELHPVFGIPMPASGQAAVVFRAGVDGADRALRFFIREDASSSERYRALGRHVGEHGLSGCLASTTWIDDVIEINGRTWPMIEMEWVDGRTLDAYVGHLAERRDVGALYRLAVSWRERVQLLQNAGFAHGDLQHGNVLVDTSSALRLVDFDGSWIAAFRDGPPPNEAGHPNYQRTGRTWGRWMDTFPGLVIYTGLLALSRRPDVWGALHTGENILLSHDDFAPPFATRAWGVLAEIGDPEVEHAVARLRDCCGTRGDADGTLEDLLGREQLRLRPPPPAPDDPDVPWWVKTAPGGAANGTGMPAPPPKTGPSRTDPPRFAGANPTGGWSAGGAGDVAPGPFPSARPLPPPPVPPGAPRPRRTAAEAVGAALGIAFAAAVLMAVVVGAAGGSAGGAAVVTAPMAFLVALLILSPRQP